jgi:nitroreductase
MSESPTETIAGADSAAGVVASSTAGAVTNPVIETLLQRRSIRKFKPDPVSEDIIATLETVAQHAACSEYLCDWSAIRITDESLRQRMAQIGNQPYISEAPLLYVFVLDEHRNAAVAAHNGVNVHGADFTLNTSYRFSQAQNDTVLAMHAMETAANSLGLGCAYLGSLLNNPQAIVDALQLPEYTYPVLGLAIGEPDQAPAIKPRMPRSMQFFNNAYCADIDLIMNPMHDFDTVVHQYYDLRRTERPVDAFSTQTTVKATDPGNLKKSVGPVARNQGFTLDR